MGVCFWSLSDCRMNLWPTRCIPEDTARPWIQQHSPRPKSKLCPNYLYKKMVNLKTRSIPFNYNFFLKFLCFLMEKQNSFNLSLFCLAVLTVWRAALSSRCWCFPRSHAVALWYSPSQTAPAATEPPRPRRPQCGQTRSYRWSAGDPEGLRHTHI